MKKNDISLVIIDAVSKNIEENGDVALANIKSLVNARLTGKVYDFSNPPIESPYRAMPKKQDGKHYVLDELTKDIIIAGGSLGNEHFSAFVSILQQARDACVAPKIHIPFNCTYSFTNEYDSGEPWTDGCLGRSDMKVFGDYTKHLVKNAPGAYLIEKNGSVTEKSPIFTLKLWDDWKQMANYLRKK